MASTGVSFDVAKTLFPDAKTCELKDAARPEFMAPNKEIIVRMVYRESNM